MSDDNRISAQISAATKQLIITKLQEIRALLPFLINYQPKDRLGIPTLGDKRSAMDQTFAAQMAAHPELVPNYVDMTELASDRALRADVLDLEERVTETVNALSDTGLAAGADIYIAYMGFYGNVQQAAKRNVAGAQTVLETLQPFIPHGRRKPPTPPAPGH